MTWYWIQHHLKRARLATVTLVAAPPLHGTVNVFYRIVLNGLRQAQRAAGNHPVRLHIRRAALSVQRQLDPALLTE
jgi:hypothetical protein